MPVDTPLVKAHISGRTPLPALTKWIVATLAAVVLMLIWLQVKVGGFFPPVAFILAPPALVVAVPIVATHRRWVPLLAVLYWTLLVAAHTWQIPYSITHPEYFDTFVFTIL